MPATDAMTLLRSLILSLRRVIVKRQLRVPAARPLEADWARGQPCPRPLLDAGGAQVGDRLYVIGGFESQAVVNRRLLVLDLRTGRWRTGPPLPPRVPESHAAICADDVRFLYVFAGQLGPNCRPAIPDGFSYDTVTGRWGRLPDLPAPRYAGTMQLLGNRLHFVGGARHHVHHRPAGSRSPQRCAGGDRGRDLVLDGATVGRGDGAPAAGSAFRRVAGSLGASGDS